MTYSNDLPPDTSFSITEPEVWAVIEADRDLEHSLEHDVEITFPYQLRSQIGFAGMSIPIRKLVEFLKETGAPLTESRDLTLRLEAARTKEREDGELYDDFMYPDLPPQALSELNIEGLTFDTGYVMRLVATEVQQSDPTQAALLRGVADRYFPDKGSDEVAEQTAHAILEELRSTISHEDTELMQHGIVYHTARDTLRR